MLILSLLNTTHIDRSINKEYKYVEQLGHKYKINKYVKKKQYQ